MEEQKKKKRSAGKVILIILAVIFLLLLIAVACALIYINSFLDKIDRQEITGNMDLAIEDIYDESTVDVTDSVEEIEKAKLQLEKAEKIETLKSEGITNILLIGRDRHGAGENGRSDSMMIVSLNHDTNKVHITSLMRAMYVCIPRSDGDVWDMLNASFSWGGTELLIATVEKNFRIEIDHYVAVDISSFQTAVDLLGGVTIDLGEMEARHVQANSGIVTSAGTQLLNGAQARAYCQIRYIDNDFVRTSRQREVVEKLMQKALTMDIGTMLDMAEQMLPLVNTDLTNLEIMYYLTKVPKLLSNPITQRMLPIENEAGTSYIGKIYVGGREMYRVDFETNIAALHEFILS